MSQIKECVDDGITPYLPSSNLDGGSGTGLRVPDPVAFGKDKFLYDQQRDVFYVCPAGNELSFMLVETNGRGRTIRRYGTDACGACPFRARCTTSKKKGRTIQRWEHQEIIDELVARVKREPEKLEVRGRLAEHPFGTMKRAFKQGYFLLKGLRKVNGEMGFTVLAYDIRRALNILGTKALLSLIKT